MQATRSSRQQQPGSSAQAGIAWQVGDSWEVGLDGVITSAPSVTMQSAGPPDHLRSAHFRERRLLVQANVGYPISMRRRTLQRPRSLTGINTEAWITARFSPGRLPLTTFEDIEADSYRRTTEELGPLERNR